MSQPEEIVFNPQPQIYDEVMGPLYFEPFAREMALRVAALRPVRLLETACGTGRVTWHLRRLLPQSSLVATDILPSMLDFAREKMKSDAGITWKQADARMLPFPDRAFDAVVCQFGAMFFNDSSAGFTEAGRVLAPGGTFLFSVWDRMEANPLGACAKEVLKTFFDGHPPECLKLAYSLSDAPSVEARLLTSGFRTVRYDVVRLPCETASARDFAHGYVRGSSIRTAIAGLGDGAAGRLEDALCAAITSHFGDQPVRSHMQAILFTAKKTA